MKLTIGSRKSLLAIKQTEIVAELIKRRFPDIEIEIKGISTKGDKILDKSLKSFGGKGVFTKEIEKALLSGEIDMAVHSAKDMPSVLPEGLEIGAITDREDARDVLVTMNGTKLCDMPDRTIIGTGSLRRAEQIKALNPKVIIKDIRGNIHTRLEKLKGGEYDGIVLAMAGLKRSGISDGYKYEVFDTETLMPACNQGILAVEIRRNTFPEIMKAINSEKSYAVWKAEKSFLDTFGGGCGMPVGAFAETDGEKISLSVYVKESDNEIRLHENSVSENAERLGKVLAYKVLAEIHNIQYGKVVFTGAGTGNKNLITANGFEAIKNADVILFDKLIPISLLNYAKQDCELIFVGKESGCHHVRQSETNLIMLEKAFQGKNIVRLKGGDNFIFGRGGEEAEILCRYGIEVKFIPGISSCYAIPELCGIPVTHREISSAFHVVTGHETHGKNVLDYAVLAREHGTLVFLMCGKNLGAIAEKLIANGRNPDTQTAIIEKGGSARQKVTLCKLSEVSDKKITLFPAMAVIGDTVGLCEKLKPHKKKLSDKKILLTGTREFCARLATVLEKEDAEVDEVSLIKTVPVETPDLKIFDYTWVTFSSVTGVRLFFEKLHAQKTDIRELVKLKFAVIGKTTAEELEKYGIFADCMPERYESGCLAEKLIPLLTDKDKVLVVRAENGTETLINCFEEKNIEFEKLDIYRTETDFSRKTLLNMALEDTDYIVFGSPSAVSAYAELKETETNGKIVAIGNVTAQALIKNNIQVSLTADTSTVGGLAECIINDV